MLLEKKEKRNDQMERLAEIGSWVWYPNKNNRVSFSSGGDFILGINSKKKQSLSLFKDLINSEQGYNEFQKRLNECVENNNVFSIDLAIVDGNGDPKIIRLVGEVIDQDKKLGISGIIQNITAREKAFQQLNETSESLKRSNQELEQFAYVASHDLQEPLRKIKAFSDLLAKELNLDSHEDAELYMERIVSAASRMQGLINDLLNYSRASRKGLKLEKVQLNDVMDLVLDDLSVSIKEKEASIKVEPLGSIIGDPAQLKRVFQNLISNSIKFSHPDRKPKIHVKAGIINRSDMIQSGMNAKGDAVELRFTDNGIGFDDNFSDKIFDLFQRLHGRSYSYQGTGIGLSVCKNIIEKHQGRIKALSKEGEGTTFVVQLPKYLDKIQENDKA